MKTIKTLLICLAISATSVSYLSAEETTADTPDNKEVSEKKISELSEVTVTSTPLEHELFKSAQPATVLSGSELQSKIRSTLGETLSSEAGVASSYYGPAASRPVIRGLSGDRIRILENGIGSQDVSNTSPDHATTIEPMLLDKIEVLRGPAALMYGTSAVGGVVNVFDKRILEEMPEAPLSGSAQLRTGSVDNERAGVINLNAPAGPFAVHFDAFKRRTDDIEIPGFARTSQERNENPDLGYPEPKGKLPFSQSESDNVTLGSTYFFDSGFVGASFSNYNNNYGVPNGEENISIDSNRERFDLRAKVFDLSETVKSVEFKLGHVNYDHTEFEGAEAGTDFKNDGVDARLEVKHKLSDRLEGVLGFQRQDSDFEAIGEEAFQPPTDQDISSIFLFEKYELSKPVSLEFGTRFDYQNTDASDYLDLASGSISDVSRNFATFSHSGGVVWTPAEDYAVALALAYTERAPSGQELYADGPHVATAAFEIGDPDLSPERSLGVDLSLRKNKGIVTGSIGTFYNRFSNYISLNPTGEMDPEDEFEIYRFEAIRADFYGFESKVAYHFSSSDKDDISFDIQPDYVWAQDRDNSSAVPRMPAFRIRTGFNYNLKDYFNSRIEVQQVFRQSRTAEYETATDGYQMLNASFSKPFKIKNYNLEFFVRGTNLLNQKARESTSFIKDIAPLPGANALIGVQLSF